MITYWVAFTCEEISELIRYLDIACKLDGHMNVQDVQNFSKRLIYVQFMSCMYTHLNK